MVENSTLGWIGIVTAVLFFGSYGVPIKLVKTGDGVFFQWVECVAILIVGYICQFTTAAFNFYPLATIGGVLWCLGNVTMVPIVNLIGLSLGLLLWSLINMLTGWFAGHFGWFVEAESVPRPVLNYLGVIIAALSAFFYLPVKPTLRDEAKQNDDHILEESTPLNVNTDFTTSPRLSPMARKIIGIALSVLAGIFYGVNMLPVKHLQDQNPSHGPLEYAFSHFTGIFFCSTAVLVLYSIYQRSLPFVNPRSILAGITAGTLWGIAQSGFFVANAYLGLTTAFPIIGTGPGVIATFWGVVVFKEIQGRRNFLWLGAAITSTVVGIILITLSHT
jgi:glucose uptake protein GlcU